MDLTESAKPATPTKEDPAGRGVGTGFMIGLFGYLVALVAFGYVGLFRGRDDPNDQLLLGMMVLYLVALVASVSTLTAVYRIRRRRRWMAVGLLGGAAVGMALVIMLNVRVSGLMHDVASGCPCEPIVDQLRISRG